MRVTNFDVGYEETRRIAEYETRKVSIKVSVAIDDGEKALPILDQVMAEVRARVEKQHGSTSTK